MNYCIWIVTKPGYKHSFCFEETAHALQSAFNELGYSVPVLYTCPLRAIGKIIVFGAHLMNHSAKSPDWIVYNLEQISAEETSERYLQILRNHEVWDYSQANIEALATLGIRAKHLPIGFAPMMARIPAGEEKYDVLFYGSMNDRRDKVLKDLRKAGVKVLEKFGVYGDDLDYWIEQSRIVINIHYYKSKLFEIVRCSYLMANSRCIVSEDGDDETLQTPYRPAVSFVPYTKLVQECQRLLGNEAERKERASLGYKIFSQHRQVDYLKAVL